MCKIGFCLVFVFILISCGEFENRKMLVIKDCTGNYIRFKGKDYRVCNDEILNEFENEEKVRATFEKIDSCADSINNASNCFITHVYEKSWVKITNIK